jgi:hypothetical protein
MSSKNDIAVIDLAPVVEGIADLNKSDSTSLGEAVISEDRCKGGKR